MIIVTSLFSNSSDSVHTKRKAGVFPFEERFRDGLVWTAGLNLEIKPSFQIPSL